VRIGESPVIDGLFSLLPPAGSIWPKAKRETWLAAATALLSLMYDRPGDAPAPAPERRATDAAD
jgi:hypothetical protein